MNINSLILILSKLLDSAKTSSAPGADQTNLTTRRGLLANSRRTTDVLVVSSSEGMLHGVLRHTTNLGPAVALDSVFVVGTSGLEQGLVGTSASGDNTDLGTDLRVDSLLTARGKTKTGGALVLVVGDDDGEASGSPREGAAISDLGLDVAHNGTLRDLFQREHVADGERGLLPAVHELSGVHALGGHHELHVSLEAVGIEELDLGDGGTASGVVKDLLDDATDVTATLGVVDGSELDGSLARARMGLEDGGLTLPLCLSIS